MQRLRHHLLRSVQFFSDWFNSVVVRIAEMNVDSWVLEMRTTAGFKAFICSTNKENNFIQRAFAAYEHVCGGFNQNQVRWGSYSVSEGGRGNAVLVISVIGRRTGLPFGPSSPGGPLGPAGPAAPGGPASPFSPLSPLGP